MNDQPNNGIRTGAQIVRAWVLPVTIIFGFSAGWFSLQGRVSAVEQNDEYQARELQEIKEDVKWLRNNVLTK